MASIVKNAAHAAERQTFNLIADRLYKKINGADDRSEVFLKLVDYAGKFWGKNVSGEKLEQVKEVITDTDNRWMKFINRVIDETDPVYAKKLIVNLGYEAFLRGTKITRENREKYQCNIPWLILFDPTSACNMHCAGCWSGTYGKKNNLSFDDMDKIVTEGKELGIYVYMMTGGEPMVRKNDVLKLAEKHNDVVFGIFTNSTLIDEELCQKIVKLGNIVFLLSVEGTPESNDSRRGDGHYDAVMNAMDLLKKYGIVFGTSVCYTRDNIEIVSSEEFLRFIASKGARFGFFFHYMPIGQNAVPELMPTIEQRTKMIEQIRYVRSPECDIDFYPMDFQNDGEYVGGCIAGGRNYFHINAHGDAEPCVFIHFSNANIHDSSIIEMLKSPLFKAYHEGQPFNRNHLRPCPMLENPELLAKIVKKTGAHQTNEESPESAEELTGKCFSYAEEWRPVADEIWKSQVHKVKTYENYSEEKVEYPDLAAFEHPDGKCEIRSVD